MVREGARLAVGCGGDAGPLPHDHEIESYRQLGALDKLELVLLPIRLGAGMRLTDSLSTDANLTFESERALPGGAVEIAYACS